MIYINFAMESILRFETSHKLKMGIVEPIECSAAICRGGEGPSRLWQSPGLLSLGGLGGGGGVQRKKKKKVVASEATLFFFFLWTTPTPQQPRVLFAYSFTLLNPFSSPIRKLQIARAFPQIHEPPYPPFIIVLIVRNLSGRIAASKNLKNHTYAKMGAPQRPFLKP